MDNPIGILKNNYSGNRLIIKNTIFLYVRMLVILVISLYTSRIVLQQLGVVDYGIYNVVGSIITMLTFMSHSLSSATQRFLSYDMGKCKSANLKQIFGASIVVQVILAIAIIAILETLGVWWFNHKLDVPTNRTDVAFWTYQFSILAFVLQMLVIPYNATIIAHEKMSFYAYVSIVEAMLKLGIVFALQYVAFDKLKTYSVLIVVVNAIILLSYMMFCRCKFRPCQGWIYTDMITIRKLFGFQGWTMLGGFADVSVVQGINLILNKFFGVAMNAAMGIANTVNVTVNSFVSNFQVAFRPQLIKSYANEDYEYCHSLIIRMAKLSFCLLFVMTVPLLLNMDFILNLWLAEVPYYANVFCMLIMIPSLIDAIAAPLWITIQATGRIRLYQIVISTILMMNLVFSYILLIMGFDANCVLWTRIAICCVALLCRMEFVQRLAGLGMSRFAMQVLAKIALLCIITLPLPIYVATMTDGWVQLFSTTIISVILIVLCTYFVVFDNNERIIVIKMIQKIFGKQCKQ